jgi:hypothetical protein
VKGQPALRSIAAAAIAATLGPSLLGAQESSTVLSPQALKEIALVESEIDRIEAQTIERLATPPDNQVQQVELLGKLMLYDKQLSVNRNEACAFCHMARCGAHAIHPYARRDCGLQPGLWHCWNQLVVTGIVLVRGSVRRGDGYVELQVRVVPGAGGRMHEARGNGE